MSHKRKQGGIYKYTDVKGAKHILGELTLLFKTPNLFNDPNDCDFSFDERRCNKAFELVEEFETLRAFKKILDERGGEIKKSQQPMVAYGKWVLNAQMNMAAKNGRFSSNPLFRILFLHNAKKNPDYWVPRTNALDEYRHKMREDFSRLKQSVFVCCFSKRNDSILMWAHYADEFKGVCIEWPASGMGESLSEIRYSERKPHFDIYKAVGVVLAESLSGKTPDLDNPIFKKMSMEMLTTKGSNWSYENEMRWIVDKNNLSSAVFENMGEGMVLRDLGSFTPTRVYLGARISEEDERDIRSLAEKIGCRVVKTAASEERFAVIEER